ncbi:hypothetical protein [Oceanithermus profundus]
MKRIVVFAVMAGLLGVLAAGSFLKSAAFRALEPEARRAVALVAKSREVKPRLARYPGWTAGAERADDQVWHVWFEREDEWLGEAYVDLDTKRVHDVYLPVDPTPAERARALPRLRKLLAHDAEVQALLEDPAAWEEEVRFDKWEDAWFVYYWRGEDAVGVRIGQDGGRYYVDEVFDPLALEAERRRRHDQDRAVRVAYGDAAVGQRLEPFDDWTAYAEPLDAGRWAVDFAAGGKTVLSVLVDLPGGRVLAVEAP